VLVAAAICPSPPLLARELTGADPVVPELRDACQQAVAAMLSSAPGLVAVVGTAAQAQRWDPHGELDLSAFAPPLRALRHGAVTHGRQAPPGPPTAHRSPVARRPPVALGLAGRLLDRAGYRGPRVLYSVSEDLTRDDCRGLGGTLAGMNERVALIAMADGSARRSLKAPGYLDERSEPFDAGVEQVIRSGDLDGLLRVDAGLARELMATGRPVWQVLGGAAQGLHAVVRVHYRDDPFGVFYLAASLNLAASGELPED
jgi:hypothetical protein